MVCFQSPNKNQPWNRNLQELQSIEALEVVEAFLKYNSVARMFRPGKGSWVVLIFFCPKNPGGEIKKKWFCGLVFKWEMKMCIYIIIYMHIFPIEDSRWGVLMNTLNDLKFSRVN